MNEGTQILSNVKGSDATITVNRGNAGTYSLASGATLSGSGTITAEDVNIAGTVELVKYTTDSDAVTTMSSQLGELTVNGNWNGNNGTVL